MEIKINVDETKFKDVLEKELNAFSKEELHEIIRNCLVEYLRDNEIVKNLFVEEKKISYYSSSTEKVPSEVLIQAAKTFDLSPAVNEIGDLMINTLKNNHKEILEKLLLNLLVEGIANNYYMQEKLKTSVFDVMSRINNNN